MPILLIITAAASSVLIGNRTSPCSSLRSAYWPAVRYREVDFAGTDPSALFPAGLLGGLIFGVSIMVQVIAGRLGRAEELARNRASDLYNLQRLNEQIVQHMETAFCWSITMAWCG